MRKWIGNEESQQVDSRDPRAQLQQLPGSTRLLFRAYTAGMHTFSFGSMHDFCLNVGILIPAEQYERKRSPLPAPISSSSSPVFYANSSHKLCIWIATGHEELSSQIYNTKQKAKPTTPPYRACTPSEGNPSEVSTRGCHQDTAHT